MQSYRGRFAPSPTGPLHFGSLFAAVISYLDARKNKGLWFVRIEDIDPLREQADSQQGIFETLLAHGLKWDQEPRFQSRQTHLYEKTLSTLDKNKQLYACPCSRRQLEQHYGQHTEHCAQAAYLQSRNIPVALKFKATNKIHTWQDTIQGEQSHLLNEDFVLKRKEGFYAYQLAVVSDDIDQNITHVVRGVDLLSSTPMQLAIYEAVNCLPPVFSHFPVIVDQQGQKLSKQSFAAPVDNAKALQNLLRIFQLLNIQLMATPKSIDDALYLAQEIWDLALIPQQDTMNNSH